VSPDRRTAVFAAGALAALTALALSGCAPVGTDGNAYNDPASQNKPAANQAAATPEPTAKPEPKKAKVELTTELNAKTLPRMGKVVTDQDGFILYRFDKDTAKPPRTNCFGKCEQVWPPAFTDGNTTVDGIDENLVGAVTRKDGTRQLTIAGWPVYHYIGDNKPGRWTGQAVGNVWFVVAPDGKKNLTCLPKTPPKAAEPPAQEEAPPGDGGYEEPPPGDGY
jgi:predicted lipoprotein with Yx(FWY)xxD motif